MSGDFIDTNVFVYLVDEADPTKRATAQQVVLQALDSRSGTVSYQVVQETLAVLTSSKLSTPMTPMDAGRFARRFLIPLWHGEATPRLFDRALEVQARYRYGFYDSLIIAGALEADCGRLLTEDLQHGQRIETLTIENPFLA